MPHPRHTRTLHKRMIGSNIPPARRLDEWFRDNIADVYTPLSPGHGPLSNDVERYAALPAAIGAGAVADRSSASTGPRRWIVNLIAAAIGWFGGKAAAGRPPTQPTG